MVYNKSGGIDIMQKDVFTILHYGNTKPTLECIDSLLNLFLIEECVILVLDNNSKTNIGESIQNRFGEKKNIILLCSDENLGFSGGNNFLYAKAKEYNPSFVAVLNNDILIKQRDFIPKLRTIVDLKKYFVIGPDVFKPSDLEHQAPLYKTFPSNEELASFMVPWKNIIRDCGDKTFNKSKERRDYVLHAICPKFLDEYYRLKKYGLTDKRNWYLTEYENPVLQGSCIIVTNRYCAAEEVLFEPNTGFYFEELLLALKCKTKGYKTLYTPTIKVIHKHALATKCASKSHDEYMVTQATRMVHAYEIFKNCQTNNPWSCGCDEKFSAHK